VRCISPYNEIDAIAERRGNPLWLPRGDGIATIEISMIIRAMVAPRCGHCEHRNSVISIIAIIAGAREAHPYAAMTTMLSL
jgi:hypothetical protein